VALYRLSKARCVPYLCVALGVLGACGQDRRESQHAPQPQVEAMPAATATADVDRRATLILRQVLLTALPNYSTYAVVEAYLTKDGFSCGANPAAPDERACLKAVRETACEINTIVRSSPYAPHKAQVIKICELESVGAQKPQ
jgi:hypothetical protein